MKSKRKLLPTRGGSGNGTGALLREAENSTERREAHCQSTGCGITQARGHQDEGQSLGRSLDSNMDMSSVYGVTDPPVMKGKHSGREQEQACQRSLPMHSIEN